MRSAVFFSLAFVSVVACQAQANCDSLYKRARPFPHDLLVMWFDKAPEIIAGREQLLTYNVPKDRAGDAFFTVLIDEQGTPLCLQWGKVSSAAVQAEAAKVVSSLRFSPGLQNGKPLKVPMTLATRFREGPPPTRKELRRARRGRAY